MKKHIAHGEHTSFSHKLLWDAVHQHLDLAEANPENEWALHLSAGLLAAASFEAYLNYIGGELLPHIWENERSEFSKMPFKGVMGKLHRIAIDINWTVPEKGKKPYSGVRNLQTLRDTIVHAKPKRVHYRVKFPADGTPKLPPPWLHDEVTPKKIRGYIADVEALACALHAAIESSEARYIIFGGHPLDGAVGVGGYFISRE